MTPELLAAIQAAWADTMQEASVGWICRDCQAETTRISEVCSGCRREFGNNGRVLFDSESVRRWDQANTLTSD